MTVLQDLSQASRAELEAIIKAQQAKLAASTAARKLTIKVNALGTSNSKGEPCKGNVAVYGLGQYPVTLYQSQWRKLLAEAAAILAVIEANQDVLAVKA